MGKRRKCKGIKVREILMYLENRNFFIFVEVNRVYVIRG